MTQAIDTWALTAQTVRTDRLSVIVHAGQGPSVAHVFETHGVEAEVVETEDARYRSPGAALRAAFDRTTGSYVLLLGGDVVLNAVQTPAFFAVLKQQGADIVIGSKRHVGSSVSYPWHRRILSAAYSAFVRLFIGVKVSDTRSGMRLFRRETFAYALERMLVKEHAFDLEILTIAVRHGAKVAEAPVVVRAGGRFSVVPRRSVVGGIVNDTLAVFYRARLLGYYEKCLVPRRLDHDPLVSVVIACPRDSWMLRECLAGLRAQTYARWEAIVLPDELAEGRKAGPSGDSSVRYLPTGKVRPAEKRNLGIREAKGEIIAFIDDDAYPDAHWLEYAVKYFGDPDIGAVGGPGVTPPGDRWLQYVGGRVYDNFLVSGNYRYRYKAGGVRMDVEDYPSCNLFVRKDILVKIGGYRTDFWPGEDTLLCKDIIDNWKRIIYEPWVVVYHHRRALFMPHLRQLGRYGFHRGYFCKRFPSNSLRASYFVPSAFVGYLLALAAFALALTACGAWQGRAGAAFAFAAAPAVVYAVTTLATSFCLKPHVWLLTALGVFLSHVTYGIRFLQGLCAKRAPCEYIGKDHA